MPIQWDILMVEDDDAVAESTIRLLQQLEPEGDGTVKVTRAHDLKKATDMLAAYRFDVLILDIRDDEAHAHEPDTENMDEATRADVGLDLYEQVKKIRFVPVIFYSAVSKLAEDLSREPFVTVLDKLDTSRTIQDAVSDVLESGLPQLNRSVVQFVDDRLKDYFQTFVAEHWSELSSPEHSRDLAHMLARRLVRAFDSREAVDRISTDGNGQHADESYVDPMRVYIIPPVGDWSTGDIVRDPTADDGGWSIMLTPACDLVAGRVKAEFVLLARCTLVADSEEYRAWVKEGEPDRGSKYKNLCKLLGNNRTGQDDRYWVLPQAWDVPGLIVDFQRVTNVSYGALVSEHRVASLDAPFVQAMTNRFVRFVGRTGTPVVDIERILGRMRVVAGPHSEKDGTSSHGDAPQSEQFGGD